MFFWMRRTDDQIAKTPESAKLSSQLRDYVNRLLEPHSLSKMITLFVADYQSPDTLSTGWPIGG